MMLDYQLFLGFPLTDDYQLQLEKSPPAIRSLFIKNQSDYLSQIQYEGSTYLGKILGNIVDIRHLESVEGNIYSLLRRLVADYSYESNSLVLIPIPLEDHPLSSKN